VLAAGSLAIVTAGKASAEETAPRAAAEASCARADRAAKELRFAEAVAAYREAIETDPSAPCTGAARARAENLAARAEGGFVPLAEVEAFRRDPGKTGDRAAVEALEHDIEGFPPGRVRVEARLLVAEAWTHRLGEPGRAIAAFEAAAADTSGEPLTRALALAELWVLRQKRGEIREALATMERDPGLNPALLAAVRRALRRDQAGKAALALLGGLAAIGAASVAVLLRRARDVRDVPSLLVRPLAVAFALYLGAAGAVLVRIHGEGDVWPFLWLGLGVLALSAVARAFPRALRARRRAVRMTWALACAAGVVAAAFLAVQRTDPSYLEGLGW
jgi:tetratricopeptide (TPR) repeat protein